MYKEYPASYWDFTPATLSVDRDVLSCDRHHSCQVISGEWLTRYETLSQYESDELDEEQNAFVKWFEAATA